MATEPENIECSACGASLRPGAAFCHKCGARFSVAQTPAPAPVSSEWFKGDISGPAESLSAEPPVEEVSTAPATPDFQDTVRDDETKIAASDMQNLSGYAANVLPIGKKMPPPEFKEQPQAALPAEGQPEMIAEPESEPAPVRSKPARTLPKTAAAAPAETLRRKPKEKIEVAWEPPDSGINLGFVIGSIVIFILVLLIIGGMFFIK
jgi:hypothetical protein